MATKKKSPPKIPSPQLVTPQTVPSFSKTEVPYQPFSVNDLLWANQRFMDQQIQYAPQLMDLYNLSAQKNAAARMSLDQQYSLPLAQLKNQQLEAVDPQFMAMNRDLGERLRGDLNLGYQLGPGLTRELQQSIRGAQTARGNVLGPSPTAQEAFGEGQASLAMYNQRLANAQNFLAGRQPTDMWGALNATEMYNPSGTYVDQQLGINAANVASQSQANYNSQFVTAGNAYNNALISATDVNNRGMIGGAEANNNAIQQQYSNTWDQYLYKQALSAGLLTQPGVSTGGAGAMGMIGQGLSGAGSLLGAAGSAGLLGTVGTAATGTTAAVAGTGLLGGIGAAGTAIGGAAAAVGSGIAAGASAIGAAVSAAGAAICWLARRAIPEDWMEWREFIFTKADPELRRAYVYNARRLAISMSWEDQTHIAAVMKRALQKK